MPKTKHTALGLLATVVMIGGCAAAPQTHDARANLHDQVRSAMRNFEETDPSLRHVLNNSAGYAMFPDVGKGGFIVGAAYGHGEVFRDGRSIGWADMKVGSVGAQAGGEQFQELIVFKTPEALYRFRHNNFSFGASASAVAVKAGAAAKADFSNGVAVFTKTTGGLMAEAAITGQKFNFVPNRVVDQNNNAQNAGYSQEDNGRNNRHYNNDNNSNYNNDNNNYNRNNNYRDNDNDNDNGNQ